VSEKSIRIDRWYKGRCWLPYRLVMRSLLVVVVVDLVAALAFRQVVLFFLALSGFVGLGGWSAWRDHRRRRRLGRAETQALMWPQDIASQDNGPAACATARKPRTVFRDVRVAVWMRDHGRCCRCGSAENLHFHRMVSRSHAETNTAENIQLMCANCHPGEYLRRESCRGWYPGEHSDENQHGEKRAPPRTGWSLLWWSLLDPFLRSRVVTVAVRRLLRRGPKGAGKRIFGG
jgi:hypothetical protein